MSDVKASVALTSDGRLQGFIGGSAANLGQVRIRSIQCQASAANGEVKIYDNTCRYKFKDTKRYNICNRKIIGYGTRH